MTRTSWARLREHLLADPEIKAAWQESRRLTEIGEAIWSARTRAGLSHTDLARRTHTRSDVIDRVELGDDTVSLDTLRRIAAALDLDLVFALQPRVSMSVGADGVQLST